MTKTHATCVAIADAGVLLFGESGAGKSDLALRLIAMGGRLVADDYTEIDCQDGKLIARVPPGLKGLLEVRGLGIVKLDHRESVRVQLAVDLVPSQAVERMPVPDRKDVAGVSLPLLRLDAFEVSAAAKVKMAMDVATGQVKLLD